MCWRKVCPLYSPIREYDPSEHSLFHTDKSKFFQPLLLFQMLPSLSPFLGLTPRCSHLSPTGAQCWTQHFRFLLPEQRKRITSLDLLSALLSNAAWVPLAFLAAKANCIVSNFVCTRTPRTFLDKLLSRCGIHLCLGASSPWSACSL